MIGRGLWRAYVEFAMHYVSRVCLKHSRMSVLFVFQTARQLQTAFLPGLLPCGFFQSITVALDFFLYSEIGISCLSYYTTRSTVWSYVSVVARMPSISQLSLMFTFNRVEVPRADFISGALLSLSMQSKCCALKLIIHLYMDSLLYAHKPS